MGAWKEDKKNFIIAKGGKKTGQLKLGFLPHKNKDVGKANSHSMMQSQFRPDIIIKQPEGVYKIKFGITWKAEMKSKSNKKAPLPPACVLDSVVEFTEIRFFVDKISQIPPMHTLEIHARLNRIQNYGSRTDMSPVAMLDIDIKTGHMVMGSWTNHMKCCDLYSWSNKIKNFK